MRLSQPVRPPAMALLWGGLALSSIGDQAYTIAFTWIAVAAFGAAAGWPVALGPPALMLTVLFNGRWADGWPPLWTMLGADVARAAVLVLGTGHAVFRPALLELLPLSLVVAPRGAPTIAVSVVGLYRCA